MWDETEELKHPSTASNFQNVEELKYSPFKFKLGDPDQIRQYCKKIFYYQFS